ncbi:MAG TPA: response regulator [Usitatibacter sp.]|jgi:DNA-binding NarL/FixJ family response regulator|nr:response regulator [Usitatibacter sp.]
MGTSGRNLPLKLVIADDSKPVAEMLRELLTDPGRVEVIGVADTEANTLEAIRGLAPDAVVLDLQLRTGSGTDVIRAVRSDPSVCATRLIVTSNHTSPQLRAGCMELGADGYFDKVKELDGLAARVRALAEEKARG